MNRRVRCRFVSLLFLFAMAAADIDGNIIEAENDKPLIKTTHVYKTVGDVKVEADVYRPEGDEVRPVVWLHLGSEGDSERSLNSRFAITEDLCRLLMVCDLEIVR